MSRDLDYTMSCFLPPSDIEGRCRAQIHWLVGWDDVLVGAWVITLRDRRGCGACVKSCSGSSPAATTFNCGAAAVYISCIEASVKD